jgi:hypothetical protein
MEITEFQDSGTRCPCWRLPNRGWDDFAENLDGYLADCFRLIAAACPDKPVAWVELNYWPDTGRLIVYPSDEGPFGDRNERVRFQLFSDHLQQEFERICELPDEHKQVEWDALGQKLWDRVGECLRNGKAQHALSSARLSHPMKLATFDYAAGEGLFHLPDIDGKATAEMKQQLADFKKRYGIPS